MTKSIDKSRLAIQNKDQPILRAFVLFCNLSRMCISIHNSCTRQMIMIISNITLLTSKQMIEELLHGSSSYVYKISYNLQCYYILTPRYIQLGSYLGLQFSKLMERFCLLSACQQDLTDLYYTITNHHLCFGGYLLYFLS